MCLSPSSFWDINEREVKGSREACAQGILWWQDAATRDSLKGGIQALSQTQSIRAILTSGIHGQALGEPRSISEQSSLGMQQKYAVGHWHLQSTTRLHHYI